MAESRHRTKFNAERFAGRKRRTGYATWIRKVGDWWVVYYAKRMKTFER